MSDSVEVTSQPVATSTTIQTSHPKVSPTGKSTSADDLLDMYEEEGQSAEVQVDKAAEAKIATEKRVEEKKLADKLATKVEAKGGVDKKEKTIDEAVKEESKKVELPKTFKAKHGDKELEIPEEAEVVLQINGKDVPVKFDTMKKTYADLENRTRDMHRKLNWVDSREKNLQKEYSSIQDKFKTISELAAQGDHTLAIRTLAEMAGKDPVEYERQIIETLNKYTEVYKKMTPEQREAHFAKRKADYLAKKLEERNGEVKFSKEKEELSHKVKSLSQANGLSEEAFFGLYQDLVKSGLFKSEEEIQPEHVVQYHHHKAHVGKVFQGIKSVDENLMKDEDFVDEVINLTMSRNDLTPEDIATIVKDAIGKLDPSVESLNRKVQAANPNGSGTNRGHASSKKENSEIDEALYEDFFGKRPVVIR